MTTLRSRSRTHRNPRGRSQSRHPRKTRSRSRTLYLPTPQPCFHQFCVVAVQALGCPGPVRLDIHYLRPGVWSLGQASAFVPLPSASFPWNVTVGGRVCLHVLKSLYYFLEILDDISSESLVPS